MEQWFIDCIGESIVEVRHYDGETGLTLAASTVEGAFVALRIDRTMAASLAAALMQAASRCAPGPACEGVDY